MITRRRRRTRDGYTLVEVMIAIAIITASSVALLAIEEVTIRGNVTARQVSTATMIARTSLELLRLDAVGWTQSSSSASTVNWGVGTLGFLRDVPTTASAVASPWAPFGQTAARVEHAYDYQGVATGVAANMFYCVESRYAWVYPGQAVRADVRVWWVRPGQLTNAAAFAGCPTQPAVLPIANVHVVQSTMVLRYTASSAGFM